jgi:hypothetical protein
MAESSAQGPETPPVERLNDHLDDVGDRSDEMQERLDELGENIEATRRQAEADELLPGEVGPEGGDAAFSELGLPEGDERRQTPVNDSDVPPVG